MIMQLLEQLLQLLYLNCNVDFDVGSQYVLQFDWAAIVLQHRMSTMLHDVADVVDVSSQKRRVLLARLCFDT